MEQIIMGLLGGAVIGIVIEVILPNKEIKKYCQFTLSIVVALIIITPTFDVIKEYSVNGFSYKNFKSEETFEMTENSNFESALELAVESSLIDEGIKSRVTIECEEKKVIFVGVELGVMADKERVLNILEKNLQIEKWRINCYG